MKEEEDADFSTKEEVGIRRLSCSLRLLSQSGKRWLRRGEGFGFIRGLKELGVSCGF